MPNLARDAGVDLEELKARLIRMSDAELIRFGRAGRYMCSSEAQPFGGKVPPRPEFIVQLEEARAEWRRRKQQKSIDAMNGLEGVDLSGDCLVLLDLLNENCCSILRAELHLAFGPFRSPQG